MTKRDVEVNCAFGDTEPSGAVFAFLDESYEPRVAAAAVVVESSDVSRLDAGISAEFERIRHWYHLEGLPSFEDFLKRGFHAASNPLEVKVAFVAFLSEVLNFKTMITYSDRSVRGDLSPKQHLMVVFDQLVRDLLLTYRSRPKIILYFESAGSMDEYIRRLVARAAKSFDRYRPAVEVRFGTKREPDLLAVADYVLHVFGQWLSKQDDGTTMVDPSNHESRSLRAILGSISMARSIDDGQVLRRTLQ
jgi:hypothetical protein